MKIVALDENVVTHLRSSFNITSISHLVAELIHNSLDAKSTAIAIRINLANYRIQVVDNGNGISRDNFELIGEQYMTNKCSNILDLRRYFKYYGYRGEALWSISKLSKAVLISSREKNSNATYTKVIEDNNSRLTVTRHRASCGTTVTVEGFLHNMPVRQNQIKVNELEIVKKHIESLTIINPRVSFTLKNDMTDKCLLQNSPSTIVLQSFSNLYPDINRKGFKIIKIRKHRFIIDAMLHRDLHTNRRLQFIFVNKRPVNCQQIQTQICTLYKKYNNTNDKKKSGGKHPIFVISIKCPYSEIDFNLEPAKTLILFKRISIIKHCIEKLMAKFFGNTLPTSEPIVVNNKQMFQTGLSAIKGVVQGYGSKRKLSSSNIIKDNEPVNDIEKICNKYKKIPKKTALPIEIIKRRHEELSDDELDNVPMPISNNVESNNNLDMTLFTNFPGNEEKGKNIIMDMFIKSVQVYSQEGDEEDQLQIVNSIEPQSLNQNSIGIQVSLSQSLNTNRPETKSIGIQVTPENFIVETDNVLNFPKKSQHYISDYHCGTSKINNNFVIDLEKPFAQTLPKDIVASQNNAENCVDFSQCFKQKIQSTNLIDERCNHLVKVASQPTGVISSPFFSKKKKSSKLPDFQQQSNNVFKNASHCFRKYHSQEFDPVKYIEIDNLNSSQTKIKFPNLNESLVTSKYFSPKLSNNKRRPSNKREKETVVDQSMDLFASYDKQNEGEFNQILFDINKKINEDSEFAYKTNTNANVSSENQFGWTKEINNFGRTVYVNMNTGVRSLFNPKPEIRFDLSKRIDCIPKGCSPILKELPPIDDLTPNAKEKLDNAMVESYEDELLKIKWQKYLDNKDINDLLNELYQEKSKEIESTIPNVNKSILAENIGKTLKKMSFTTELFNNIKIIGQLDCKFIVTFHKDDNLLLLFDQHAVHERIRLEQLLRESCKNYSVEVTNNITIFLPSIDLDLIASHKTNIYEIGFVFTTFSNGIVIKEVPACLFQKHCKGANMTDLTEKLIKEIIDILKTNGTLVNLPNTLQNIIKSTACRGAIKFGDELTKEECCNYIQQLSNCNLPFQCAHGRPTLTPLIELMKNFNLVVKSKPKLNKLSL